MRSYFYYAECQQWGRGKRDNSCGVFEHEGSAREAFDHLVKKILPAEFGPGNKFSVSQFNLV